MKHVTFDSFVILSLSKNSVKIKHELNPENNEILRLRVHYAQNDISHY